MKFLNLNEFCESGRSAPPIGTGIADWAKGVCRRVVCIRAGPGKRRGMLMRGACSGVAGGVGELAHRKLKVEAGAGIDRAHKTELAAELFDDAFGDAQS